MPQQLADCQRETGVKGYLSSTVIDRVKRQVGHVQLGRRFDAAKEALVQCNDELLAGTLLFPRFDAQQHIPTEILHTFLLGVIKVPVARDHQAYVFRQPATPGQQAQ